MALVEMNSEIKAVERLVEKEMHWAILKPFIHIERMPSLM